MCETQDPEVLSDKAKCTENSWNKIGLDLKIYPEFYLTRKLFAVRSKKTTNAKRLNLLFFQQLHANLRPNFTYALTSLDCIRWRTLAQVYRSQILKLNRHQYYVCASLLKILSLSAEYSQFYTHNL